MGKTALPSQATFTLCRRNLKNAGLRFSVDGNQFKIGAVTIIESFSNGNDAAEDDEIRDCLDLLGTPMALKTHLSLICNDSVQFQLEIRKN